MTDLEKLYGWLREYPDWPGLLQVDRLEDEADGIGIYPQGLEEISRQEDIQGNLQITCRYRFDLLRRVHSKPDERENTQWLLEFQNWVQRQSTLGLAPRFGDIPHLERMQARKGELKGRGMTELYAVTLLAEFTRIYQQN